MYYEEHGPAHFHAIYSDFEAVFEIETLKMVHGKLPARAKTLVLEWAFEHRDELVLNWERARKQQPLQRIDPLE